MNRDLKRRLNKATSPCRKRVMVLSLQMERKSGFPFAMSVTERGPKTGLPREVTKLTKRVSSMTLEEPMRKRHRLNPYLTWTKVKNMTRQAEQTLKSTGTPMTPDKLFLAMLAVLSCSSGDIDVSTQDSMPPTMESN
ncbi:inteferon-activable protein 208-like [Bos javanicus]|uniref:inteferon-activable protein 208-like n=1 Tax=Bos javanicus TaxID=9906 RepID=UPI002AA78A31|nr:inteferon-activable protein 208-like [Bos javanicus]